MACNNTHTPADADIANASTVPLSHPTMPALSAEFERRFEELFPEYQTVQKAREALLIERSAAHNRWFQSIGEMYATKRWAAPQLGVEQVGFVPAHHGFDHVGRTPDGRIAVFETKCYAKGPPASAGLEQLSRAKVERQLDLMTRDGSSRAQGPNPEIAAFAEEEGYVRYLVHVGYESETVRVYEVVDDTAGNPMIGSLVQEGSAKDYMGEIYSAYFAGPQGR